PRSAIEREIVPWFFSAARSSRMGPPPPKTALAGRMNPHGISVFYGATDPMGALGEVRPPVASRVVIGRFALIQAVRVLDVEALRMLNGMVSISDGVFLFRL